MGGLRGLRPRKDWGRFWGGVQDSFLNKPERSEPGFTSWDGGGGRARLLLAPFSLSSFCLGSAAARWSSILLDPAYLRQIEDLVHTLTKSRLSLSGGTRWPSSGVNVFGVLLHMAWGDALLDLGFSKDALLTICRTPILRAERGRSPFCLDKRE